MMLDAAPRTVRFRTINEEDPMDQSASKLSWWLAQAQGPAYSPTPPLTGAARADVCVVGGGYTGLWTALQLKEQDPTIDVVLLEAAGCGSGASGRNGGLVLSWWAKLATLIKVFGAEEGLRMAEASADAVSAIGAFCDENGIDCHFRGGGWLWTGTNQAQLGARDEAMATAAHHGRQPFQPVEPADVVASAGSATHAGAVFEPTAATVQPALLAMGLRRVALERGVRIHEYSPATSWVEDAGVAVTTPSGTVHTGKLVLATNAWMVREPEIARMLVVVASDMVVTRPIPELLDRTVPRSGLAVSDSRRLVNYYRTTDDQRLAVGHVGGGFNFGRRISPSFNGPSRRAGAVTAAMTRLYRRLDRSLVVSRWTGPIDRSISSLPVFGPAARQSPGGVRRRLLRQRSRTQLSRRSNLGLVGSRLSGPVVHGPLGPRTGRCLPAGTDQVPRRHHTEGRAYTQGAYRGRGTETGADCQDSLPPLTTSSRSGAEGHKAGSPPKRAPHYGQTNCTSCGGIPVTSASATDTSVRVESRSPQDPHDLLVSVAPAGRVEVATATTRARVAQREWWAAGAGTRANALKGVSDALSARAAEAVDLMVREVGKPVVEARGEVARARSILDFYAQQSFAPLGSVMPPSMPGMLWTERRPHGVAGLVTPWNFPLAIPLWKAAPALAAGNAVLLKPAPEALATAQWLVSLVDGLLPEGLLQVLPGGPDTGRAVVEEADVVSFTGSAVVGRQVSVAAAHRGAPVQAEMGGQNAAIVLPDADAAHAGVMIANACMGFAGQKCTATRRVVVVGSESRQREVRDALVAAAQELGVGDPRDETTQVGPVVNEESRRRVVEAAETVRGAGGRILVGGAALDRLGWFVSPGLADGVDAAHTLAQEELFGPFALVLTAADIDEAVTLAEGVRYGLVTSVHGRDAGELLDVVSRLGTGMVKVNAPTTGVDFYAPFGGERDSSYGPREQGAVALDFYSSSRTVTFARHA